MVFGHSHWGTVGRSLLGCDCPRSGRTDDAFDQLFCEQTRCMFGRPGTSGDWRWDEFPGTSSTVVLCKRVFQVRYCFDAVWDPKLK